MLIIPSALSFSGSSHIEYKRTFEYETVGCVKVLAVSDIVIFRTRAERLHSSMFAFLGDASKNWRNHFERELRKICKEFEKADRSTGFDELRSPTAANAFGGQRASGGATDAGELTAEAVARLHNASGLSASVTMSMLGPALIVFHETTHVETLDFSAYCACPS